MKTPTQSEIEEYVSECVDNKWNLAECRTDLERVEARQHNLEIAKEAKRLVRYYQNHPEEFWMALADYNSDGDEKHYKKLLTGYMK